MRICRRSALLPDPQPPPSRLRLVDIDIPPTGRCIVPLPGTKQRLERGVTFRVPTRERTAEVEHEVPGRLR